MDDEFAGTNATTIVWDEIVEQLEQPNGNGRYYNFSTSGTATVTLPSVDGYRSVTGIDWGNTSTSTATTVSYGSRQTFDTGYVYAPYVPVLGSSEQTMNQFRAYQTFEPVIQAGMLGSIYFDTDKSEFKLYIEPTDHFIDHEDLFEI